MASVGWPGIRLWGWNQREQLQRATGWPTSRGSVRWLRPLRVKEIAEQKASAPGQLALAWVMAQGNDVVPIPGTKRRRYLEENIAAADIELSDGELARIDEVAPLGATAGDGNDETGMTAVQG